MRSGYVSRAEELAAQGYGPPLGVLKLLGYLGLIPVAVVVAVERLLRADPRADHDRRQERAAEEFSRQQVRQTRPVQASGNSNHAGPAVMQRLHDDFQFFRTANCPFTSTEVVYGVTDSDVTDLPKCGVSP